MTHALLSFADPFTLEAWAGMRIEGLQNLGEQIRIVGGGSRNRLLNQFTANATGRIVVSGPVEATALGNIAMQMLATGAAAQGQGRETAFALP